MSEAMYGIAGTMLGTCVGFILDRLSVSENERTRTSRELERIKTEIATTCLDNLLSQRLLKLKRFLHINNKLLRKRMFLDFMRKWLMTASVEMGSTPVGEWNQAKKDEMISELLSLRI